MIGKTLFAIQLSITCDFVKKL